MGKKYSVFIVLILQVLIGCEVVQETKFEKGGSGIYSMGFDMSEFMEVMGKGSKDNPMGKQVDTVMVFSEFLDIKKDSISNLSKEERNKLMLLEDFRLHIKMDSISRKYEIKIDYSFDKIKDLGLFGEKLKNQKIKELAGLKTKVKDDKKTDELLSFNQGYITKFSKRKFSTRISEEALIEAEKSKDTTLKKSDALVKMFRLKTRYIFPYKVKTVSNDNAVILSDLKGIEISGDRYDINSNPRYFDVEVKFER